MSKLTALKRQIASLEAQAERIAKTEMASAIAKVKDIMSEFNLTIEHLTQAVTGKRAAKKAKVKTASAPKYADPKTGKTWSGFGRAPGWIAGAKNRDAFLVDKAPAAEPAATKSPAAKKSATKVAKASKATKAAVKSAAKKAAPLAKKAAVVAAAPVTATKKPAAKKAVSPGKKAAAAAPTPAKKKPAAKKAPAKKAAAKKPAPHPAASAPLDAAATPAA